METIKKLLLIIVLILLPSLECFGEIYKCTVSGKLKFQDTPCSEGNQEVLCPNGQSKSQYDNKECPETNVYNSSGSYQSSYTGTYSSGSYGSSSSRRTPGTDVRVRSYYRKDGTYVKSHTRSRPGKGKK